MGSINFYIFTRFFGIVLLQSLVIFAISWGYFSKQLTQDIIDENFARLKTVKKSIRYFYHHQADELQRVFQETASFPYNRELTQKLIEDYIRSRKLIASVHYYRKSGELEFVSRLKDMKAYKVEKNYKDHRSEVFKRYFEKVLEEKKTLFSPPIYTRSKKIYHVGLVPIFEDEELHGVLSFSFFPKLNPFSYSLEGLTMNSDNFILISNENGDLISAKNIEGNKVDEFLVSHVQNRGYRKDNPFNYRRKSIDELKKQIGGKSYYIISMKVSTLPFLVILGVNELAILSKKEKLLELVFIVISFSALIGFFASLIISRNLNRGLQEVINGIKDLKKGIFKKNEKSKLQDDFSKTLDEIEDISIEIKKGQYLGHFWGQGELIKDEEDKESN